MAPSPDTTPTETAGPMVVETEPAESSTLPGMKRGIAIGVACSVGIIMIALLAFFAYRRRKKQAAKHTRLSPEEPVEMDAGGFWPQQKAWPQEKPRSAHTTPIEADAHVIHELEASEVPELPGHYEGQELNTKKTPRASYHAGDDDLNGLGLKQWNEWNAALAAGPDPPIPEPTRNSNPYLEVSPSRPHATSVSPIGDNMLYTTLQDAPFGSVSPIVPSPLTDAHTRDGQRRQHRYYEQPKTST